MLSMLRTEDFCAVSNSWLCKPDITKVTCYSVEKREQNGGTESSTEDVRLLEPVTCSQPDGETCGFELTCTCRPQCSVHISSVTISSEARTVECYGGQDGYLSTIRGCAVHRDPVSGGSEDTAEIYKCTLKLENLGDSITLKMRGLGEKSTCKVYQILICLRNKRENEGPTLKKSIDMTKVRGYLDSMGTEVPANAKSLFSALEQYQKIQESSMSHLHSMLPGGPTTGGAGMNGLSGLLAMATSFGAFPSMSSATPRPYNRQSTKTMDSGQSLDTESSSPNINKMACDEENKCSSRPDSPLSKPDEDLNTADAGQTDMLQMLQGICGKMGSLRMAENNRKSLDSVSNRSTHQCEPRSETSTHSSHSSVDMDQLQPFFQQTMTAVKESEDRLKKYIDSSLAAMEARICNKLDNVLQTLQQNLQENKISGDTES